MDRSRHAANLVTSGQIRSGISICIYEFSKHKIDLGRLTLSSPACYRFSCLMLNCGDKDDVPAG